MFWNASGFPWSGMVTRSWDSRTPSWQFQLLAGLSLRQCSANELARSGRWRERQQTANSGPS